jgi:hypothetical protein
MKASVRQSVFIVLRPCRAMASLPLANPTRTSADSETPEKFPAPIQKDPFVPAISRADIALRPFSQQQERIA